jgi:hypothetical protein
MGSQDVGATEFEKGTVMHNVTVATFNEPEEAAPLKHRLEAAGIPAQIHDERNLQKYWFMSESLAGIRLHVDRSNYEKAMQHLESWDLAESALSHAIRCPECRSSRVEYPQFTRKFISPTLYALFCKVGMFEKRFYCEECHYTWPTRVRLEPARDLLNWPLRPPPAALPKRM